MEEWVDGGVMISCKSQHLHRNCFELSISRADAFGACTRRPCSRIFNSPAMQDQPGRFPPPWDIEEYDRSCFIVRDNNGQALAYCY